MGVFSLLASATLAAVSLQSALAATTTTTTPSGEAWTVKPSCAVVNKRYIDADNHNVDLTTNNSLICQEKCVANVTCAVFTYYPDTRSCWLQTAAATLNDTTGAYAIAGPQFCTSSTTTTTTTTTEEAGGFPWWGWLLIALGVLCCLLALGLAYYLMSQKKTNRKPKKAKRALKEEAPLMTVQAPMAAPVPVQYFAPVQTYAAPPVYVTSATPVTYAAPAPAALTYTAPAPTTVTYATGGPESFIAVAPSR